MDTSSTCFGLIDSDVVLSVYCILEWHPFIKSMHTLQALLVPATLPSRSFLRKPIMTWKRRQEECWATIPSPSCSRLSRSLGCVLTLNLLTSPAACLLGRCLGCSLCCVPDNVLYNCVLGKYCQVRKQLAVNCDWDMERCQKLNNLTLTFQTRSSLIEVCSLSDPYSSWSCWHSVLS